uniref:RRM domain-containing protein n=1 Tax=Leersia perrieri TaxID=77586 RepID=A0A0D9XC83_9ORYZ
MGRSRGRGGGGGGGRARFGGGGGGRGDGPSRYSAARDDPPPSARRSSGWGVAPPSRHLWVGGLGAGVDESDLSELFLRCGDVEGISRDPGRSFAFVTFAREEDAVAAVRELQGIQLRGAPIRIEFSKGDKASSSSMDDRYSQHADQRRFTERGRNQQSSPEKSVDRSKRSRPTEPSEVLWIGLPVGLKVDEATLWEAFSPFGEVVKITTFPGRTYAFVQYTTITAACRAKETLQGNLFNNPRVSICFSRSDGVSAEFGKGSIDAPYSPHLNPRPVFREQDFEAFPRARPFDSPPRDVYMPSPHFGSKRLSRDPDDVCFSRDNYSRYGPGIEPDPRSNFEPFRMRGLGSERRMSEDPYEQHRRSPSFRGDAPWHNIPFERSQGAIPLEDSWNTRDDSYPFSKKLRTGEAPDPELPEYPFSEFDRGKVGSGYPRRPFYGMPEDDTHPGAYQLAPMHGRNHIEPLRNPTPLVDRQMPWHSQDSFSRQVEVERSTPEHHEPLLKEEWKWDGTIAKGGTPICRARCFPVGKVLNFMLPEFLNCTARTSLEMLAKHYYQAASSWVVFFVPENDADMAAYNEFMTYLGDKQRAAVCKLGERSSLFLVPPSDFSEQVLRVPGKVSISGVILKFESDPEVTSPNRKPETFEKGPLSLASHLNHDVRSREDLDALRRPNQPDIRPHPQVSDYIGSSPGSYTPANANLVPPYKFGNAPYLGSELAQQRPPADSHREIAQDKQQQHPDMLPSRWSDNINNPNPGSGNFNSLAQSAISHRSTDRMPEAYSFSTQGVPKASTSGYAPVAGETSNMSFSHMQPVQQQVVRPQQPPSLPVSLPPEQLAQLATLLAHQNQGKEHVDNLSKQSRFIQNPHGHASMMPHSSSSIPVQNTLPHVLPSAPQLQVHAPPNQGSVTPNPSIMFTSNAPMPSHNPLPLPTNPSGNPAHSSMPLRSFVPPLPEGPPPLRQHTSSAPQPQVQPAPPSGQQTSQQLSAQEDHNGDPQKRLQATLQLAATLLQQIQQQSKPGGQN